MNYGIVIRVLGILLLIESVLMVPSLLISVYSNGPDTRGFLIGIAVSLVIGFFLTRFKSDNKQIRLDGLSIVTLGWLMISLIGQFPLLF